MTPHRLLNTLLAALGAAIFAAVLSASHLLDGPTDHQARTHTAQSANDATREARHQARFQRAAQKACAGHGTAEVLPDNSIQCTGSDAKTITIAKVTL